MKEVKQKDLAFPSVVANFQDDPRNGVSGGGLTKREYFAGFAMQGLLAQLAGDMHTARKQRQYWAEVYPNATDAECIAKESVLCADELLKQLEK